MRKGAVVARLIEVNCCQSENLGTVCIFLDISHRETVTDCGGSIIGCIDQLFLAIPTTSASQIRLMGSRITGAGF